MSQFTDAITRLTIDTEFARHTRHAPEQVASIYALTPAEAALLRELANDATVERIAVLRVLLDGEAEAPAVTPTGGLVPGFPTLLTLPITLPPARDPFLDSEETNATSAAAGTARHQVLA
jgi:hypothetical protein